MNISPHSEHVEGPSAASSTSAATTTATCIPTWLKDALESVPVSEKEEFVCAMNTSPHLVPLESNPAHFLVREDGNANKAATRLALYWKSRKKTFGERAFLPMTLTGDGAMDASDIELARTGFFVPLLPDKEGSEVYVFDRSRLSSMKRSATMESRLRVFFYLFQVMMESSVSRKFGIVGLRVVDDATFSNAIPTLDFFRDASTVNFKSFHVCVRPPKSGRKTYVETIIPIMMQKLVQNMGKRVSVIVKDAPTEFATELATIGITKEGLPAVLGGTWQYGQFDDWLEARVALERKRYGSNINMAISPTVLQLAPKQASPSDDAEEDLKPAAKAKVPQELSAPTGVALEALPLAAQRMALEKALDLIPATVKTSYLEALRYAPQLVETELDPIIFLRFEDFDAHAAACRLVAYWEKRKEVFGKDRAFLPIRDLTGKGALNEADVNILTASSVVQVSNDSLGGPVLCTDLSRMDPGLIKAALESRDRILFFYLSKVAVEDPSTRTSGECTVLVRLMQEFWDRTKVLQVFVEFESFLPLRFKAIRVLIEPPVKGRRVFVETVMPVVQHSLNKTFGSRASLYIGPDILRQLEDYGLTKTGLPPPFGGTWSYDRFYEWLSKERGCEPIRDATACQEEVMVEVEAEPKAPAKKRRLLTDIAAREDSTNSNVPAQSMRPGGALLQDPLAEDILAKEDMRELLQQPPLKKRLDLLGEAARKVLKEGRVKYPGSMLQFEGFLDARSTVPDGSKVMPSGSASGTTEVARPRIQAQTISREEVKESSQTSPYPQEDLATLVPPPTELHAQVSGHSAVSVYSSIRDGPVSDQDRRTEVLEALERIPYNEKAAYLEALQRVPDLVEKESRQDAFLFCENYNANATARRLVAYWEMRKAIFGANAFHPMTQTGEGALNRGDLTVLASCYFAPLPNDRNGRTVFCYDASKLGKCAMDSRLRLTFYLFSVAAENQMSRTDGCIVLCIKDKHNSDRDKKDILGPILDVLPVRIKALHVIHREAGHRSKTSVKKIAPAIRQLFGKSLVRRTYTHSCTSREEIVQKLDAYGLSKDGLPKSLGGDWGYQKLTQWQELRTRLEWGLPPGSAGKEVDQMFNFASIKPLSDLTEEEKTERKRRMNVIHSRRKRERERIEIEVLQEHCSEIGDRNKTLADENKRFEELLESATSQIALLEPSTLPRATATASAPSQMGTSRAFPSVAKIPAAAASASLKLPDEQQDTYAMDDDQPGQSILEQRYIEQSLRDHMAAQSAREQELELQLRRELGGTVTSKQRSLRDQMAAHSPREQEMESMELQHSSFHGGGAVASKHQSRRDYMGAQAAREQDMQTLELQRELQLQLERGAQRYFLGGGAITSKQQSLRDFVTAQVAREQEMQAVALRREIDAQSSFLGGGSVMSKQQNLRDYIAAQAAREQGTQAMELDAQSSFLGGGAVTSLGSIESVQNSFVLNEMLRRQELQRSLDHQQQYDQPRQQGLQQLQDLQKLQQQQHQQQQQQHQQQQQQRHQLQHQLHQRYRHQLQQLQQHESDNAGTASALPPSRPGGYGN